MSKEKFDFSKLKDIGSMDIKDIVKLFKKDKSSLSYEKVRKKKVKEKAKLVLSIEFGTNSIKLVEGKFQKGKLYIYKAFQAPTPEGTISDGKILNKELVVETLRFLIKQNNIKAKNVIFTTNSSSIINRDIVIPRVKFDEMETVIRYEIQQYLPINLDEYILQFIVLDEINDGKDEKLKVSVTSFPQRIAAEYYNVINDLELNPYALDVEYNSINKLVDYCGFLEEKEEGNGSIAFIDMGASYINTTIFKNKKLDFTRMIKVGGDDIDYAVSQRLNVSLKSAEAIKIRDVELLESEIVNDNAPLIKEIVNQILDELDRILRFYNNKSDIKISNIYIYGGTANIKGLNKYMEDRFNIPVNKIEYFKNIEYTSQENIDDNISQYLNSIGAIIRL